MTSKEFKIGDLIQLPIDRLSYDGGRGVGRVNNFVVFVENTAPQDLVRAKIISLKKNYGEAELVEVIKPSPNRRIPECAFVQSCGGCVWQHINYPEQLKQKRLFLAHHLKKFVASEELIPNVHPSPQEFRYRNRVQIHAIKNSNGDLKFGFFRKKSRELVPINDCLISDRELFLNIDKHLVKSVEITPNVLTKIELDFSDGHNIKVRNLSEDASHFSQVNTAQNLALIDYVTNEAARLTQLQNFNKIYDLYCGSGNLTFPLARKFTHNQVTGVELNKRAIDFAQRKSLPNTTFIASDVFAFLKATATLAEALIILDPARAGLDKSVCRELIRLKPRALIYVSCSLTSLARDLSYLCEQDYTVDAIQAFDMFPQTDHIETVVTLLPRAIKVF